jgi:hypothetical protein
VTLPPFPDCAVISNDGPVPGTAAIPAGTVHWNEVALEYPVTANVDPVPTQRSASGVIIPFPVGVPLNVMLTSSVSGVHPAFEIVQRST